MHGIGTDDRQTKKQIHKVITVALLQMCRGHDIYNKDVKLYWTAYRMEGSQVVCTQH